MTPATSSGKQSTLSNTHLARAALQSASMKDPNFLITTPRLTISYLDPSNPSHCQFMVNLWNTPEFITMLGGKPTSITTPSAAKSLIENRFIADHERNGYGIYLVSLLDDGQPGTPIGTVSLMRGENSSLLAPDIGFAMLSEYMRKGYAVEAGKALIDYVGKEQGVTAIFGFCNGKNEASMGALRRLGLKWEGLRVVKDFGDDETACWSWGMEDVREYGL
ncbi:acyl-CoA N-acyltransferase [Aureobasidium pullulans]|uniref:Acyl-CoA N-acyltransferase n=1 Tax=Aureobasidium pullulans TaxID=5580 RepID=A0A4S9B1P5_AURPU|nr:acyl-CoA N-acyltransferase [Aureobasidium pullulans]